MAPNLDLFLMAPVMRNPPLYGLRDLDRWVTLKHVCDAHEIMKLEAAGAQKQRLESEMGDRP